MPELVTSLPRLPLRPDGAHKGTSGRVALVAGSRGTSGAATLAGLGALRTGAGLVRVYTPESVWPIVAAAEPGYMVIPTSANRRGSIYARNFIARQWPELVEWSDVVGLGPGLGRGPGTARLVRALAGTERARSLAAVLDADALYTDPAAVLEICRARSHATTILTPHPGEMSRLRSGAGLPEAFDSTDEARLQCALEYAALSGAVLLLKGNRSIVAHGSRVYVNSSGNPGMATGGMGDVLTGIIAALVGQGMSGFDASCLATFVHGAAGDQLARELGPIGFTARDVALSIPTQLARHYGPEWEGI